jgi:hypothetical protein
VISSSTLESFRIVLGLIHIPYLGNLPAVVRDNCVHLSMNKQCSAASEFFSLARTAFVPIGLCQALKQLSWPHAMTKKGLRLIAH